MLEDATGSRRHAPPALIPKPMPPLSPWSTPMEKVFLSERESGKEEKME